jgi:hypothetical protein
MQTQLRIIVTGLIAQYPLGGVAWDYLQYVLGLADLGYDVYYLEDTGQWPYSPVEGGLAKESTFNVQYLAGIMSRFGLDNKWAYRFPWESQWFGLEDRERSSVIESADLLINVSGTLNRPHEYRQVDRLAYIDSDPIFTQIKIAKGQTYFASQVDEHDTHFTFGETLCNGGVETGHSWRPTRQPIILAQWHPQTPRRNVFTTVMNWTSYNDITYEGRRYGQKDSEFMHFIELPSVVAPTVLEVAVNVGKTRHTPYHLLAHKGWHVVDPAEIAFDMDNYREYIQSSKAEWSVAKNGYVVGSTGWFSCRSACYLAAGKPVVLQDTGFSSVLPVGEGIFSFTTMTEAADAIKEVEANYSHHAAAARQIAEEYFDSRKVLDRLIEEAMASNG